MISRLILLEFYSWTRKGGRAIAATGAYLGSRRGNAAAFFHYGALFFCRGQSEPDEGFWRLVVGETCDYESVKREIGTRCRTRNGLADYAPRTENETPVRSLSQRDFSFLKISNVRNTDLRYIYRRIIFSLVVPSTKRRGFTISKV